VGTQCPTEIVIDGADLLGDGVNVAARSDGLAEPGGVRVSAWVREDAIDKLDLDAEALGMPPLKNVDRAMQVSASANAARAHPRATIPKPAIVPPSPCSHPPT
jgi:class 3 adenylate cyclase